MNETDFQILLAQKGRELYRDLPWRRDTRPFYVLVSELMLQQTQVERVIPKFVAFVRRFPSSASLAAASLSDVLQLWSGLGYNRRAKYLHDAAKKIEASYAGCFPKSRVELLGLPGVGPSTAGAVMAYAYNEPAIFVETNVRTVYFEHFFPNGSLVADKQLRQLVERTLDIDNPREFYWSLMDYGAWLKRGGNGRLTQSRHYKKQAPLKGSLREVRGRIVKELTGGPLTRTALHRRTLGDGRFEPALLGLVSDGLVQTSDGRFYLTK